MHRLNELASKLTESELKEVEDFAEFLVGRQTQSASAKKDEYLDVGKVAGMLAGLAPDKTAVELAHEANDIRAKKYEI